MAPQEATKSPEANNSNWLGRQLQGISDAAPGPSFGWIVDLDRGLRSTKPGGQWEAILRIGPHLTRWRQDLHHVQSSTPGDSGEPASDLALANTVLLKLADTFRTGSNDTRRCILKVFALHNQGLQLSPEGDMWQAQGTGSPGENDVLDEDWVPEIMIGDGFRATREKDWGLLVPERVLNAALVLKRVQAVLASQDAESRSLALRLIGCMAPLAMNSAETHRAVLEALTSSFEVESEAANYAAQSLIATCPQFAAAAVPAIAEILKSEGTSPLLWQRTLHLLCSLRSHSLLLQAHEMLQGLLETLWLTRDACPTLRCLTALAARCPITLPRQIFLLLGVVQKDPRTALRVEAVKGLRHLAHGTLLLGEFRGNHLLPLVDILTDRGASTELQMATLQALQAFAMSTLVAQQLALLSGALEAVEGLALHPDWPISLASLKLLVRLLEATPASERGAHAQGPDGKLNAPAGSLEAANNTHVLAGRVKAASSKDSEEAVYRGSFEAELDPALSGRVMALACEVLGELAALLAGEDLADGTAGVAQPAPAAQGAGMEAEQGPWTGEMLWAAAQELVALFERLFLSGGAKPMAFVAVQSLASQLEGLLECHSSRVGAAFVRDHTDRGDQAVSLRAWLRIQWDCLALSAATHSKQVSGGKAFLAGSPSDATCGGLFRGITILLKALAGAVSAASRKGIARIQISSLLKSTDLNGQMDPPPDAPLLG